MVATAFWYGVGLSKALNKEVDLDTDDIKVALCTSTYVPDQDTHDYFNDITNEVVGDGYVAGGTSLANGTVVYTAGTNVIKYDAGDVTWAASTITARFAIVYDAETAVAATSPLLLYVDFGEDKTSSGGDFTIGWNAAGIATITVS